MQKYNFVIFQENSDYFRISYSDLRIRQDVIYIDRFPLNKSISCRILHRFHHSIKINSIINLPYKNKWFPYYFKNTFLNLNPLCFIFNARSMQFPYLREYVVYLKNNYKDAKFVCFYQDLINTHIGAEPNKISHLFDILLSYDRGDAKKYNLIFHPTAFSRFPVTIDYSIPESEVYFIGHVKNRFELILKVYDKLKKADIKCVFYLSGVPANQQIKTEGIYYIKRMSYIENLKHVARTKCILEIMQDGANGSTLRTWEAIMYDKKLLTNNLTITDNSYYNSEYISIIRNDEIDIKFLKQANTYINPFKDFTSPDKLLDFISDRL